MDTLQDLVNKWIQREHGSDDVDQLNDLGGIEWLEKGLKTDSKKGFTTSTIDSRTQAFGSNKKAKIIPKNLCQLMWDAFEDLILRVLFVAGIITIAINVWAEADHRSTAWIEGAAILIAVALVVVVTAVNDLKKE